jgi:hypothetical protein
MEMNINAIKELTEKDGIVFLAYGGFLSQTLISGMTEALEKETQDNQLDMGLSSHIFTIFIELAQNMMNYSKKKSSDANELKSQGLIVVGKDELGRYYVHSQNVVSLEDKQSIEPKLIEIHSLDKEGIKQRYKELRRSGKNTHGKGGGIGFYEIAKRCDVIKYDFIPINDSKFYFHFYAIIDTTKE